MRKEQETKITEDCVHTELHHKAEEDDKDESTSAKHFIRVARQTLELFYENVVSKWRNSLDHILSHVILAPPIESSEYHVNYSGFTQNITVMKADKSKIDGSNFLRMYLTSAQRSVPLTLYPI